MSVIDYHSRMNGLHRLIQNGSLGPVTLECMFSGRHDLPMQPALRNLETGQVDLAELHNDGLIIFKGEEFVLS